MEKYRHFGVASYMYAYYAAEATDRKIREAMEIYLKHLPLSKVYVENYRGTVDVPAKRLREIRNILEEFDIEAAGGIPRQVSRARIEQKEYRCGKNK